MKNFIEVLKKKIGGFIPVNLAGLIGIVQGVVKVLKETCTAIVNILFPLITNEQFKLIVEKIRTIINKIDEILEKAKTWLLSIGIK